MMMSPRPETNKNILFCVFRVFRGLFSFQARAKFFHQVLEIFFLM